MARYRIALPALAQVRGKEIDRSADWSMDEAAMRRVGAYEAKTHLPRLLDEVATGESIEITRHGVPVAVLSPVPDPRADRGAALQALLEFRHQHPLGDVTIRQLIEEGRR